jgi:biotin carboxylase
LDILIVGSQYNRNNNLTEATNYSISKGIGTYVLNGIRLDQNYTGRSEFGYYTEPDVIINYAVSTKVDVVVLITTQLSISRDIVIKEKLEALGIKVISHQPDAMEIFQKKSSTRELFEELDVQMPKGFIVSEKHCFSDIHDRIKELRFPILIKQTDKSGGNGITIHHNVDSLINECEQLYKSKVEFVLEEFTEGTEYSVEVICYDGEYFMMSNIDKGSTSYNAHSLDRMRIAKNSHPVITDFLNRVMKKLSNRFMLRGILEFDLILNPIEESVSILEVNPRMGGVSRLDMEHTNISIPQELIKMATGEWCREKTIQAGRLTVEVPIPKGYMERLISVKGKLKSFRWNISRPRNNTDGMVCLSGESNIVIKDLKELESLGVVNKENLDRL